MGIVILMPRVERPAVIPQRRRSTDAEIVFFTGVRYERHEERPSPPRSSDGSPSSRQRRRRA